MKKYLKFFNINQYSFSTKVLFSFLIFLFIFILIRTSLSIPKLEKKALETEIEYITKSLLLLKDQIRIIGKSLRMQSKLEIDLEKEKIDNKINTIKLKNDISKEFIIKSFEESELLNRCKYKISPYILDNKRILEKWKDNKSFYSNNYKIKDFLLNISCLRKDLNKGHMPFEISLKKDIHANLITNSKQLDTKTAFVWISKNLDKNDENILYEKDKIKRQNRYGVSMLSNVRDLPTGNISVKEFFEASKSPRPIIHKINNDEVFTWIIDLKDSSSKSYFIVHTISKKNLESKNRARYIFLLPESLIAIGISFIFLLLLLRRILKNINTLTTTAIKVNKGKKNIRSNVKGDDDIGILGKSFDSMLDFFENSIETLDKKVQEKTKEISKSLDEKEVLLKEIHHRVKNNLALTISFIELQEDEIEDEKVKKVLIDIKERIYTMELIHRKLYESNSLDKIPFKEYVNDLANVISKTYNTKNEIDVNINVDDIQLDIQTAMPCGLLINELLTNSFKHAFLDNKKGKIDINITKNQDKLKITLQDNGKGFSQTYEESSSKSLGLRLVNTIVKYQLFGKISYIYDKGAKFDIECKLS